MTHAKSDYDILSASPTESFGEIGSPDESEIGLLKSEENVSDSLDTENLISSLPVATGKKNFENSIKKFNPHTVGRF